MRHTPIAGTLALLILSSGCDCGSPGLIGLDDGGVSHDDGGAVDAGDGGAFDAGLHGGADGGCVPKSCAMISADCGSPSDGCGSTLSCGTCASGQTCGGAGTFYQCGALPGRCVQGFCWESPLPSANGLRDVFALDSNEAWAVGDVGTLVRLTATGFAILDAGTSEHLTAIGGVSSSDVWIGAGASTFMHWTGQAFFSVSNPSGSPISDIEAVASNDVWAATLAGPLLHWDGTSWAAQTLPAPTMWELSQVSVAADGAVFYANGRHIFRKTNAGWTVDTIPDATLHSVAALSKDAAFAAGYDGTFFKFDGTTWVAQPSPTHDALSRLYARNATEIWAVGDSGGVARWDGTSWAVVDVPTDYTFATLQGVAPSGNGLWVVGDPFTLMRFDGQTWTAPIAPIKALENSGFPAGVSGSGPNDVWVGGLNGFFHWDGARMKRSRAGINPAFGQVWAHSPTLAYAAAASGEIARWDGQRWTTIPSPQPSAYFFTVWGSGPSDVWIGSNTSSLLHYDGSQWSQVAAGLGDCRSVFGFGPGNIWALSSTGAIAHFDGSSWSPGVAVSGAGYMTSLWGTSSSDLYAVGWGNTIAHWDGSSWTAESAPATDTVNFNSIWGTASDDVWAVGTYYGAVPYRPTNTVFHKDSGGWHAVPELPKSQLWNVWGSGKSDVWVVGSYTARRWNGTRFTDVSMSVSFGVQGLWSDGTDGWAVGRAGKALRRVNGSWTPVETPTSNGLNAVVAFGPNDAWASGDWATMLRWNGTTWSHVPVPTHDFIPSLWGASSNDVYAATGGNTLGSGGGRILHWDGSSWTSVLSVAHDLRSVYGTSANDVWVVGSEGFVAHHTGGAPSAWTTSTLTSSSLSQVAGVAHGMFTVGFPATVLRYDGNTWAPATTGAPPYVTRVAARSPTEAYLFGPAEGPFYGFGEACSWNGSAWSCAQPTDHTINAAYWVPGGSLFIGDAAGGILRHD